MSRLRLADLGNAGAMQPLSHAVAGQPGRFRRVIRLSLPTGGQAETLHFLPGATLAVQFGARDFDALAPGAPLRAQVNRQGGNLVLSLPRAARVARIEITAWQTDDVLRAYRFDGEAVSDDPVASPAIGSQGAALGIEAASLILRRLRSGAEQTLSAGDVAAVWLHAPVTLPRLAIALVDDPAGWQALPPQTDDDGNPVFPAAADRGADVAAMLETALARWRDVTGAAVLPDPVAIDLALEADAACAARLTALVLDWRLGRAALPDGAKKVVLRLPAGPLGPVSTPLGVPRAAGYDNATMAFTVAGGGRSGAARDAATGPLPPAASGDGRVVAAGGMLAGGLSLAAAQVVVAVEVAVAGIDGACTLRLSGWSDAGGAPGRMLFAADLPAVPPGAPRLQRAPLAGPVAVDGGLLWLGVEAVAGRCVVALTADGAAGLVARDGPGWDLVAAAAGRGLVAALIASTAEGTGGAVPRFAVTLGGVGLAVAGGAETFTADLRPALVGAGGDGGFETLTLAISGPGPAVVTLRAPALRYRVNP